MKKLVWIPVLLITLVIVVTFVGPYLWTDSTNEIESVALIVPLARTSQTTSQFTKAKPSSNAQTNDDDYNPYEDEVFKAQLLQVADLYEETSRYPVNSQPIRNIEAAREPAPFDETEVDTPFPSDDGEPAIRLQAAVDKFQYFKGETINVRLNVVGAPDDVFVKAAAIISGAQGDTPLAGDLNPSDESLASFTGAFDLQVVPSSLLSSEMLLKILVTVDERQLFTTVGFRYAAASATLVGVPYQRQEGAYLNIPLQYSVNTSGYYFVRGVLEEASSGRPLIQLQAEGRMNQGNGLLVMRAHFQALKAAGSEGPYVLRSVLTHRGAEQGETFDAPASSAQNRFEVQGYPFAQYDDEPYQDPDAQDSIDFIRGLGNGD